MNQLTENASAIPQLGLPKFDFHWHKIPQLNFWCSGNYVDPLKMVLKLPHSRYLLVRGEENLNVGIPFNNLFNELEQALRILGWITFIESVEYERDIIRV